MIMTEPGATLHAPIQNIEAEHSVLGGILLESEAIHLVKDYLPAEAFYIDAHRKIYRVCLKLAEQNQIIDITSVVSYLNNKKQLESVGGMAKIAQLVERTVTAVNIEGHARLLVEKYERRRLIEAGNELVRLGYESYSPLTDILEHAEDKVLSVTQTPLRYGADPGEWQHANLIKKIRAIEVSTPNPSLRTYKLRKLSKESGLSTRELEELYFRQLIHEEYQASMNWDELVNAFGSDIREWLLHGWMPKGSTILLHAKGGIGKTRFVYNLAYLLATGQHWNEFSVTAPAKGLIIQTDETGNDMIAALKLRGINATHPLQFKTQWSADHIYQLREEIIRNELQYVIIDSLITVNKSSEFSENDAPYAKPILLLKDICQELGVTCIIIHHSSAVGTARGSTAIFNAVSEVWHLDRDPQYPAIDARERLLTIEKSRSRAPAKYNLIFNDDDGSWTCLGKEGQEPTGSTVTTSDAIVEFLRKHPNIRYTAVELDQLHNLPGSFDHIRSCCSRLAKDGVISVNTSAKPYSYFICGGADRPTDDQQAISRRSVTIPSTEPSLGKDSSFTDHENPKNEQKVCEEKSKNQDPMISESQEIPETVTEKEIHLLGIATDHPLIATDQPSPAISEVETVYEWNSGDRVVTSFGVEGEVTAAGYQYICVRWSNKKEGSYKIATLDQEGITKICSEEGDRASQLELVEPEPTIATSESFNLETASIEELKAEIGRLEVNPKGQKRRIKELQKQLTKLEEIEATPPIEREYRGYRASFKKTVTDVVAKVFNPNGDVAEHRFPGYMNPMTLINWFYKAVENDLDGGVNA